MTEDQERWAEALAVMRDQGARAPVHVVEQVARLALAGDMAGVARWRAIAVRMDRLLDPGRAQ